MEGFESVGREDRAMSFCELGMLDRFLGIAPRKGLTCNPGVDVDLTRLSESGGEHIFEYIPLNGLCLRSVGADGGRPVPLGGPGYGGGIGGTGPLFRGAIHQSMGEAG